MRLFSRTNTLRLVRSGGLRLDIRPDSTFQQGVTNNIKWSAPEYVLNSETEAAYTENRKNGFGPPLVLNFFHNLANLDVFLLRTPLVKQSRVQENNKFDNVE